MHSSIRFSVLLFLFLDPVTPWTTLIISGTIYCRLGGPFQYRQKVFESDSPWGWNELVYDGEVVTGARAHVYNVTVTLHSDSGTPNFEIFTEFRHNCNTRGQNSNHNLKVSYDLGDWKVKPGFFHVKANFDLTDKGVYSPEPI